MQIWVGSCLRLSNLYTWGFNLHKELFFINYFIIFSFRLQCHSKIYNYLYIKIYKNWLCSYPKHCCLSFQSRSSISSNLLIFIKSFIGLNAAPSYSSLMISVYCSSTINYSMKHRIIFCYYRSSIGSKFCSLAYFGRRLSFNKHELQTNS